MEQLLVTREAVSCDARVPKRKRQFAGGADERCRRVSELSVDTSTPEVRAATLRPLQSSSSYPKSFRADPLWWARPNYSSLFPHNFPQSAVLLLVVEKCALDSRAVSE